MRLSLLGNINICVARKGEGFKLCVSSKHSYSLPMLFRFPHIVHPKGTFCITQQQMSQIDYVTQFRELNLTQSTDSASAAEANSFEQHRTRTWSQCAGYLGLGDMHTPEHPKVEEGENFGEGGERIIALNMRS